MPALTKKWVQQSKGSLRPFIYRVFACLFDKKYIIKHIGTSLNTNGSLIKYLLYI